MPLFILIISFLSFTFAEYSCLFITNEDHIQYIYELDVCLFVPPNSYAITTNVSDTQYQTTVYSDSNCTVVSAESQINDINDGYYGDFDSTRIYISYSSDKYCLNESDSVIINYPTDCIADGQIYFRFEVIEENNENKTLKINKISYSDSICTKVLESTNIKTCGCNDYEEYGENVNCERIICKDHSYLDTHGTYCECETGYQSDQNNNCIKICDQTGEELNSTLNECQCIDNYLKNEQGKCIYSCPSFETANTENNGCVCSEGYKRIESNCIFQCGDHQLVNKTNNGCYCIDGYVMVSGFCIDDNALDDNEWTIFYSVFIILVIVGIIAITIFGYVISSRKRNASQNRSLVHDNDVSLVLHDD
ncbi:hypothetical protein QTN25_001640 [Entamoeba marina]